MVDLLRLGMDDGGAQRVGLTQIAGQHLDVAAQVLAAGQRAGRALPGDPDDGVVAFEQQLRQERAVLTGDARDQGCGGAGHRASL